MVADPAAEKYVEGKVTVSGDGPDGNPIPTLGEVGIRFKGFYGSLRMCLPGGGRSFACKKLSYKLNFKIANKTQTFFGLKRLQLHSGLHDISLMQEMLTYSLFREMGVATVRMTHCVLQLQVGDEVARAGVYMLTELLDGRFTDAYFRGGNGNLYKEAWPGFENAAEYDVRLRTNEDRLKTLGSEKTHAKFMEFSEKLALARDDFDLAVVMRLRGASSMLLALPRGRFLCSAGSRAVVARGSVLCPWTLRGRGVSVVIHIACHALGDGRRTASEFCFTGGHTQGRVTRFGRFLHVCAPVCPASQSYAVAPHIMVDEKSRSGATGVVWMFRTRRSNK